MLEGLCAINTNLCHLIDVISTKPPGKDSAEPSVAGAGTP